jgi:hypothetical protein
MASKKIVLMIAKIILLIGLTTSSLIYENKPKSLLLEEMKNELLNIQKMKSISKIDFGNFEYTDTETKQLITIQNVTQQLNYLDVNRLILNFEEYNYVVNGLNGTLSMKYNFEYKSNLTEGNTTLPGNFSFDSVDFSMYKNFSIKEGNLTNNGDLLKLSFKINDVIIQGDLSLTKIISSALNSFYESNLSTIKKVYSADISKYYQSLLHYKQYIHFDSKIPKKDFTLDFTLDRLPFQVEGEDNVIYYRSGNINKHTNPHKELQVLSKDQYSLFISKQVFVDFLSDMIDDGMLDFTLTQKNKPLNLDYNLNIQSLGEIMPEVYNDFSREDQIQVWSKLVSADLNSDKKPLSGQIVIYSEIYLNNLMRKLLTFNSTLMYSIKPEIKDNKINFFIDYNVDIISVNYDYPEQHSTVFVAKLKRWIEQTLKVYLYENKFTLLENDLDLSYLFTNVKQITMDVDRVSIYGSPAAEPEDPSDSVENKMNSINEIYFDELKFLN